MCYHTVCLNTFKHRIDDQSLGWIVCYLAKVKLVSFAYLHQLKGKSTFRKCIPITFFLTAGICFNFVWEETKHQGSRRFYHGCWCRTQQNKFTGRPDLRYMLWPIHGARDAGLCAPFLQSVHQQVLEGYPGTCYLSPMSKSVQHQTVPDQLPGDCHGG